MVKQYDDVYLDDITFCVSFKNIAKTVSKFKDVSDCSIVDLSGFAQIVVKSELVWTAAVKTH